MAVDAQTMPTKLAMAISSRAPVTLCMVSPMKLWDTGMMPAMASTSLSSSSAVPGPNT